jgi:hypothetical protein
VLGQALLLLKQVAKLLVLGLQDLVLAIHLGHDDGIGGICRLSIAGFWGSCSLAALLGLLQNIELSLHHRQLYCHATRRLLAFYHSHVVLQLGVGGGQSHIAQGIGEVIDHGTKLFG